MTTGTALITDSTALLTSELVDATGAIVVPVTVTVDGVDYADGVDLSADRFYELLAAEPQPTVSTAQPSPAAFVAAFDQARGRGASAALAVLVGSAYSGTLDSARVAAASAELDVVLVDSGLASFGVGLCVLAAAEALGSGATPLDARDHVLALAATVESVFIIQALELATASGRFGPGTLGQERGDGEPAIPVLALSGGELDVIAEVTTLDDAVDAMAARVRRSGGPLRVASGLADQATRPVADALERRLEATDEVAELIRYRVGPGVGANTGPGTAGVFWHPLDADPPTA